MAFDKIGKPSDEMTDFVTKVLDHHQKVLGIRKENLRDCNGDLAELSESLDRYLDDWYSDKVKLSTFRLDRRSAYIIYCPELHQIPYQMLKNLIEGSSGKVGLEVRHSLQYCLPRLRIHIVVRTFLAQSTNGASTFF